MKYINFSVFTILISVFVIFLSSCSILRTSSRVTDGGSITISQANPKNPEEVLTVRVDQPQNPSNAASATITIDEKTGKPIIKASTGGAQDSSQIEIMGATIDMLNPVIYVGTGMILLGAGIGLFFRQIYWGICIGGVGVCMVVGSFLLAKYSMLFLLGLAVFLGYMAWLLYRNFIQKRANEENVAVLEKTKEYLDPQAKKEIFEDKNSIANLAQSDSTKKIVDEAKEKIKENSK